MFQTERKAQPLKKIGDDAHSIHVNFATDSLEAALNFEHNLTVMREVFTVSEVVKYLVKHTCKSDILAF